MHERFTPFQLWLAVSFVWIVLFGWISIGWYMGADSLDGLYDRAPLQIAVADGGEATAHQLRMAGLFHYRNMAYANAFGWGLIAVIPPFLALAALVMMQRIFRAVGFSDDRAPHHG